MTDDPKDSKLSADLKAALDRNRSHQEQAAEIDRVVYQALETFRALESLDATIMAGACAALARFTANAILRAGGVVSVRTILTSTAKLINFSAEQVILGPSREVPEPGDATGPEGGATT